MREQLIQYVNLLFAGAPDCDDMKDEILQNTLDRYDDLIAEGKVPQAAYRMAITGIGDINEILGTAPRQTAVYTRTVEPEKDDSEKKKLRAIAIALYILCPIPLFVGSEFGLDVLGLCGLLVVVAVATSLMILSGKKESEKTIAEEYEVLTPQKEMRKSIRKLIWVIGLSIYLVLSFATKCWYITWLIFPIIGALNNLLSAIIDLKEATENET